MPSADQGGEGPRRAEKGEELVGVVHGEHGFAAELSGLACFHEPLQFRHVAVGHPHDAHPRGKGHEGQPQAWEDDDLGGGVHGLKGGANEAHEVGD